MSDETMIQEAAARLFADHADDSLNESVAAGHFPAVLWEEVEAAGFPLALVAGEQGFGLEPSQALPIFEELGRHRLPIPLAETAVGLSLLDASGHVLPAGPGTLIGADNGHTLQLEKSGGQLLLSGTAKAVAWGRHAQWAVVQSAAGQLAFVELGDPNRVAVAPHRDMAGLPSDILDFSQTPARLLQPASIGFPDPLRALSALAHSFMMAGAMQWVLEQTIQYANDRVQFGKPIGKNQALQQQLARAAGDVASAQMAAHAASMDVSSVPRDPLQVLFGIAVAKIRCSEAASHVNAVAHQIMGAIGFTHEHSLHYATRRLWSWRDRYGSDAWWAQQLGEMALRNGADSFWPAMTQRKFSHSSTPA